MNKHEEINALIPFYISGKLTEDEYNQVKAHLKNCMACREELAMWQDVSGVMAEDYQSPKAPQGVLVKALEVSRRKATRVNIFAKFWKIVGAQIPLVNRDVWQASLLVLILGFVITLIADQIGFLFAIAPLVSAGGLAFIYNKEHDPAFELVLSTPISQIQILLARSVLVFGYNFILVAILFWGLSLYYSTDLILPLILEWLAPMTFLSALGLCISIFSNSENAIAIAYSLWLSKYLLLTLEFKRLFGRVGEFLLLFWQTPMALYIFSICLFAAMLIYIQKSNGITRQLT
jgi:hypothetical protein